MKKGSQKTRNQEEVFSYKLYILHFIELMPDFLFTVYIFTNDLVTSIT